MNVLQNVETALSNVGFSVGKGRYPDTPEDCGKIVFSGEENPVRFMGGGQANVETFKVIVKGNNYNSLEQKANTVRVALKSAGFIQIGGYEDVEPRDGETFMQLAVHFKSIR